MTTLKIKATYDEVAENINKDLLVIAIEEALLNLLPKDFGGKLGKLKIEYKGKTFESYPAHPGK